MKRVDNVTCNSMNNIPCHASITMETSSVGNENKNAKIEAGTSENWKNKLVHVQMHAVTGNWSADPVVPGMPNTGGLSQPDDSLVLINCFDIATPDEITLSVTISSLNGSEELEPRTVVDTGAGRSYLLAPESKLKRLPLSPLTGTWIVQFADNYCQTVSHGLRGFVTVHALDMENDFRKECTLLVLKTKDESQGMQMLIGRDLIDEFHMQLDGTTKAWINGRLVYEAGDLVTTHVEDQVYMLQGTQRIQLDLDLGFTDEQEVLFESYDLVGVETRTDKPLQIEFVPDDRAVMGRPVISIPWLGDQRPSVDFESCYIRDKKVTKRLTPEERALYVSAVEQLVVGGFAVEIPDTFKTEGHFIAVRPVFKADRSSTKCRLCLDARGLNKLMATGPQVGIKMLTALLLFRSAPLAATFDLTKAFWQVLLRPEEQKYFSTVVLGKRYRFTRMIFGGNFSPSGLESSILEMKRRALEHLAQPDTPMEPGEPERPTDPSSVNFVDDFQVTGQSSSEELLKRVKWIRWWFEQHGFPSDKLRYNSRVVTDQDKLWEAYLSYRWNEGLDQIRAKTVLITRIGEAELCDRKRLVGIIMKLYDPFGFRLRLQLAGRMLIRECCQEQRKGDRSNPWKMAVSRELRVKLNDWIGAVNHSNDVEQHPRYVNCDTLYCFCDASFSAWSIQVHGSDFGFLCAKGGLIKNGFTIPKAELAAVHYAVVEIADWPLVAMCVNFIVFLTDNEATVHRLRNPKLDKSLKTYELNRVRAIRKTVADVRSKFPSIKSIVIQHLSGSLNPADYATRPYPLVIERPIIDKARLKAEVQDLTVLRYDGVIVDNDRYSDLEIDSLLYMTLRSVTRRARAMANSSEESDPPPLIPLEERIVTEMAPRGTGHEDPVEEAIVELTQKILKNQELILRQSSDGYLVNIDGLLTTMAGKIVIVESDDSLKKELMNSAHLPHHYGINATKHALCKYYWKGMTQDVSRFVRECQVCSLVRIPRVIRTAVGSVPWIKSINTLGVAGIVGIDVCEMKETTNQIGFVTTTCAVSKWVRAQPVSNLSSAEICLVLRAQFEATIFPRVIVSDGGSCFKARMFSEFCREHGILHLMAPHYSSAYNGWFERSHESLLQQLRLLVVDHPELSWVELLSTAVYLVNTRPYDLSDESGLCPLHLVFGNSNWKAERIDGEIIAEVKRLGIDHLIREVPEKYQRIGEEWRARRQSAIQKYLAIFEVKRDRIRTRLKDKVGEDLSREFPVGAWVRVYRPPSSKVTVAFSEPRKIVEITSEATRLVEKADGKRNIEYIANLNPY